MTGKKILYLVLGSLSLAVGALIAVVSITFVLHGFRVMTSDPWNIAEIVIRFAAAVYFICIGARTIRRVGQEVPRARVGWGRLLFGCVLIYVQIKEYVLPSSRMFQPDNESQAMGMRFASATIVLVAVALIVAAFRTKKQKPAKTSPEKSSSAATQE